jgi:hypothetical protein
LDLLGSYGPGFDPLMEARLLVTKCRSLLDFPPSGRLTVAPVEDLALTKG